MRDRELNAWIGFVGIVVMVVAAGFIDWRAGLFIGGLFLWADSR